MNKAYSVVWNHARQTWIVVSELSRCHGVVLAKKTILTLAVVSTIGNSFCKKIYQVALLSESLFLLAKSRLSIQVGKQVMQL